MHARTGWLAIVGLAAIFFGSDSWAVCYVSQNATGKNNGTTWTDAYVHPQLALLNGCTEIWVAKGVYTPAWLGSDPTISFEISAGTKMYGGFAGGESSVDQRLPSINQTVLSGDVDHNDFDSGSWMDRTTGNIIGTNSHHIVTMQPNAVAPITSDTVLDGFLIVGGHATLAADVGGGFYCGSDDAAVCGPTLSNLIFLGNTASDVGGAVAFSNVAANPKIINSIFRQNFAYFYGGAIFINSPSSSNSVLMSGCAFTDNTANDDGGAIEVENAKVNIVNTTFFNNESFNGNGGAIDLNSNAPLSVNNVTFAKNSAQEGGAISNLQSDTGISPGTIFVTNSIFWSNSAFGGGTPDIEESARNFAYVASSILEYGCPDARSVCLTVSTTDPKLSSPADHGGSTITLFPGAGGSAVDTGDDGSACPPFDQRGVARPQGAHCDIGAVEWQPSDDIIFRNGFQ